MASPPYLIIGPTTLLSLICLALKKNNQDTKQSQINIKNITVDVVIPAHNEQANIASCLSALAKQTLIPRNVYIFDDNSSDDTYKIADALSKILPLNITLKRFEINQGKTVALKYLARNSNADVQFVLDGDSVLISENYIERTVQELFKHESIGSVSGNIKPIRDKDHKKFLDESPFKHQLKEFMEQNPNALYYNNNTIFVRIQRALINIYRELLYAYLKLFVFKAQMGFMQTIINPIGCAVAYRREYLKYIFDECESTLGNNLTTSEDIYIGFSFANHNYQNKILYDIVGRSLEPEFSYLFRQIFLWSSSFVQCSYYFNNLVTTPFKIFKLSYHRVKQSIRKQIKQLIKSKEDIDIVPPDPSTLNYAQSYGRSIGWFMFSGIFEKVFFPMGIIIMMILNRWELLLLTITLETLLSSTIVAVISTTWDEKVRNFTLNLLMTPIRYITLFVDIVVVGKFATDVWITKNRQWRK